MWKFVSYDLSGSCISSNGPWTKKATKKIKLSGKGRSARSTKSSLGTIFLRLPILDCSRRRVVACRQWRLHEFPQLNPAQPTLPGEAPSKYCNHSQSFGWRQIELPDFIL